VHKSCVYIYISAFFFSERASFLLFYFSFFLALVLIGASSPFKNSVLCSLFSVRFVPKSPFFFCPSFVKQTYLEAGIYQAVLCCLSHLSHCVCFPPCCPHFYSFCPTKSVILSIYTFFFLKARPSLAAPSLTFLSLSFLC
jgi:hypothetical protein